MPSVVVDASAIVDLLTGSSAAPAIFARLIESQADLHAPHSIDLEVANAVRRMWRRGLITQEAAEELADAYLDIPIARHPHRPLLQRVWELRHNNSAYDAAYVALAETLRAPLLTRDRRLSQSAGHTALIHYIA
jgi:predicted nucleic acid-binding protein